MVLSDTLFNNLTNKLKLETSLLEKEKFYVKNLLNQITYLKKFKENNSKKYFLSSTKGANLQDFMIVYIINISFLKANTVINISDTQGNLKLFYSAGAVELSGKQKKKRRIAVSKLISLVLKKTTFFGSKPTCIAFKQRKFL
jgi:ribosomal protein S11